MRISRQNDAGQWEQLLLAATTRVEKPDSYTLRAVLNGLTPGGDQLTMEVVLTLNELALFLRAAQPAVLARG